MHLGRVFISLVATATLSMSAVAQDFVEVTKTLELNASVSDVWAKVGDFCAIKEWHPAVSECSAYDDHGTYYRTLTLADGATISEKRSEESNTSYTYFIKKSPLPVKAYKASFTAEGDASKTTITWTARFRSKGATDDEAKGVIEGIFQAGLDSIKGMY